MSSPGETPEQSLDRIVNDVLGAPREEQQRMLTQIRQVSEEDPANATALLIYARCLAGLGDHFLAVDAYGRLVEAFPDDPEVRHQLAVSLSQVGNVGTARAHLDYIASNASDQYDREYALQQRALLDEFQYAVAEDSKLLALQAQAILPRIDAGTASEEHFLTIARGLIAAGMRGDDETALPRASELLERARSQFPDSIVVLEHLTMCYSRVDPQGRFGAVMRELEARAPESEAVKLFAEISGAERAAPQRRPEMELLNQATSEDQGLRDAALRDLAAGVARSPRDADYRVAYAFALALNERHSEAVAESKVAEGLIAVDDFALHFNLGQALHVCGQPVMARAQLLLAERHAPDAAYRQRAADALRALDGG